MSWKAESVHMKMFFFKRFSEESHQNLLNELISELKKTLNHEKSADSALKQQQKAVLIMILFHFLKWH